MPVCIYTRDSSKQIQLHIHDNGDVLSADKHFRLYEMTNIAWMKQGQIIGSRDLENGILKLSWIRQPLFNGSILPVENMDGVHFLSQGSWIMEKLH